MLSRRKFLQANAAGLALPLTGAGRSTNAQPPTGETRAPEAAERDYWNDWPRYLTAKMNEARARRKAVLARIATPSEVQDRIAQVRPAVWRLIGGPLEKTPLNPQWRGSLEPPDHAYRIEKVIFESQPQIYVTAHLYVPQRSSPPFPAILAPLGHTGEGKAYRNYMLAYQMLARKGYLVFAFDPFGQGERKQYFDPVTRKPRYGPTGEHSQAGRPLLLLGATFAQYRVWDCVRALDYLLSRPEADLRRVGCTGHSGGGTMTEYLCALEPRIQVAVEVEGNSENMAGPDYSPPGASADAEQNLVGSLPLTLDRGDLMFAFAPRPLLICYTPLDEGTTYSPAYPKGTQEIFAEVGAAYSVLGSTDRVALFSSPLPHDFDSFNRRTAYAWFNRWLAGRDLGTEESEFDQFSPEALNCTDTGEVLTSLGGRSVVDLNRAKARALASARASRASGASPESLQTQARAALSRLLSLPESRTTLEPRVLSSNRRGRVLIEEIEFRSQPAVRIPGWFLRPDRGQARFPAVLVASDGGKDDFVAEPSPVDELLGKGYAVCAVDWRGFGVATPKYPSAGPLFYGGEHLRDGYAWAGLMLGKPVLGQRVWDFLRALDYLESRADVDHRRLHAVGEGEAGLAVLMGSVMDERPQSILLSHTLADFSSLAEADEYHVPLSAFLYGILREADLPDLAAALGPRRCWLLNAANPVGQVLPESAVREIYARALRHAEAAGSRESFRLIVQPDQEWTSIALDWLSQR